MEEVVKEFELESGEKIKVYKPKVKHLVRAQQMIKSSEELVVALISQVVEINGQKKPYEEWLNLDLSLFMRIVGEIAPFLGVSQKILQFQF